MNVMNIKGIKRDYSVYLILLAWFVTVMSVVISFSVRKVVAYDPFGDLIYQSSNTDFEKEISEALDSMNIGPGTMLHVVSDKPCFCDDMTNKYSEALYEKLEESGFTYKKAALMKGDQLSRYIVSTPTVITVGHDGRLKYLGPYATGLGCFTGDTDIEGIYAASIDNELPGPIVNAENVGCYCQG